MRYEFTAIQENEIPAMKVHSLQYALNTYASETNKVVSTWRAFVDGDLGFRPHPKSSTNCFPSEDSSQSFSARRNLLRIAFCRLR